MIKERYLIGLAVIAVLAACGGGGGGSTPSTGSSVPSGYARALFSLTVPGGSSSSSVRRAQYVAPGTQSIELTLIQADGVAVSSTPLGPFNLTAGSPGCATTVAGLTCSFSISAPIGTDVYLATTYSQINGQSQIGSGAVALSVAQNSANQANLVLSGPIQSIVAFTNNAANNDTLWNGIGQFDPHIYQYSSESAARHPQVVASSGPTAIPSERLYFIASDVAGNVILNPTTYDQPIVLTLFLNGGPANVTLADVPPSGIGSAGSTATNGGTVDVYSPSDVVTLSIIPTVNSPLVYSCCGYYYLYGNFPYVTATLASPPPNFGSLSYGFQVQVVPTPTPSPSPSPSPSPTGFITVIGS
jgi:hypothetical protein